MEEKGKIIKLSCFILLLIFAIPSSALSEPYLRNIQKRYSDIKGLVISYERELFSNTMGMMGKGTKEEIAKGKIFLKPPYFLRIEQEIPQHELVINNGKYVWWYIPLKKIAYKYKSEEFSKELNILKDIFAGMSNIRKEFSISLSNNEKLWLLLRPKKPYQDIEKIEINVDRNNYRIKTIKIYNLFGSITCFRLRSEIRTELKNTLFSLHLPEGIRIIEK